MELILFAKNVAKNAKMGIGHSHWLPHVTSSSHAKKGQNWMCDVHRSNFGMIDIEQS